MLQYRTVEYAEVRSSLMTALKINHPECNPLCISIQDYASAYT